MTFREMVYDAGVTCAQISRKFGYHDDWARERLYSRRIFSAAEVREIAGMTGLPFDKLYAAHKAEAEQGGLHARRPQENIRPWTEAEIAMLRQYAADGRTMAQAARDIGRSYNGVFSKSSALGLDFVRAAAGEAADMIARVTDDTKREMTEQQIAALYAGRRYDNASIRREGATGRAPMRPDRISASGNAAAMCVEAAR